MSFLVPAKITSKLPFSRFKTIEESRDFLLQQRKAAFRREGKSLYRITTREKKNGHQYEIANGDDLDAIHNGQWRYINSELPTLVPATLSSKDRVYWLISHFTQLALGAAAPSPDPALINRWVEEADQRHNPDEEDEADFAAAAAAAQQQSFLANSEFAAQSESSDDEVPVRAAAPAPAPAPLVTSSVLLPSSVLLRALQSNQVDDEEFSEAESQYVAALVNAAAQSGATSASAAVLSQLNALTASQVANTAAQNRALEALLSAAATATKASVANLAAPKDTSFAAVCSSFAESFGPFGVVGALLSANALGYALQSDRRFALLFGAALNIYAISYVVVRFIFGCGKRKKDDSPDLVAEASASTAHALAAGRAIASSQVSVPAAPAAPVSVLVPRRPRKFVVAQSSNAASQSNSTTHSAPVASAPASIPAAPAAVQRTSSAPRAPQPAQVAQSKYVPSTPPLDAMDDDVSIFGNDSPVLPAPAMAAALPAALPASIAPLVPAVSSAESKQPAEIEFEDAEDLPVSLPPIATSTSSSHLALQSAIASSSTTFTTDVDDNKLTFGNMPEVAADSMVGHHTWCEVAGDTWNVRVGPNYAKNKKKAPSKPNLCRTLGVDLYASDNKIPNFARHVNLPRLPFNAECERLGLPQPPVFVVNTLIPGYEPSNPLWGSSKSDGRGYELVFYFALKEDALREWQNPNSTVPAINLLRRFVAADLDDDKMHERFKAITRIQNIPDCEFGSATAKLATTYNGTPFLTRPQHKFYRGQHYFEIDVDVHVFSYMARTGMAGVQQKMVNVIFDFAFVVEAYSDDEQPENILGCARVMRLDLSKATEFPQHLLGDDE